VPQVTRNDRNATVDVQFVLTRGERVFVERIDIEGNTTTLDSVVRRQFRTVEGDPFNPREIRQSAERIRALGFFANTDVQSRPGSSADQVVIKVNVEEEPTGSVSFGASYGTSNGVGLNLGYNEINFLGRGQGLNLTIQSGADTIDSSFAFVEPTFLGRDLRFRFSAQYSESTQNDEFYDTRIAAISPSLEFPVSERGRVELRYRLANETIMNVDAGTVDDPATPEDETSNGSSVILQGEEGTELSSALGYSYSYDTRRSRLDEKGFLLLRFGQDFAGVGGDVQSITTTAFALAESRVLNEEVAVRMILEGGMVHGYGGYGTRVTDRFFGSGKIRGFEPNGLGPRDLTASNEDALGGNMFAVARFETEFPLGLPEEYGINGGLFFDVGSVWGLDDTAGTGGTVDDSFHLRSVAGVALLWETPIGPLRFNFTRALLKEDYDLEQTFDLTISTKF
jgi:outer membrane protein insertion porin family